MKFLILIFLALATLTVGAAPYTTTTTDATATAQTLFPDDTDQNIDAGMTPLAGMSASSVVGDGLQSITGRPVRGSADLVTLSAINPAHLIFQEQAETQSDKEGFFGVAAGVDAGGEVVSQAGVVFVAGAPSGDAQRHGPGLQQYCIPGNAAGDVGHSPQLSPPRSACAAHSATRSAHSRYAGSGHSRLSAYNGDPQS